MTQSEKLEALVRKAIDGGWLQNVPLPLAMKHVIINTGDELGSIHEGIMIRLYDEVCNLENVIFDHDFARALFGEKVVQNPTPIDKLPNLYRNEDTYVDEKGDIVLKPILNATQYHLQQAVVSTDPIGYFYKELFSE